MTQKIALLRGVNVGGHKKLPMKELAKSLEQIGCKNIQTFIQSGNIVFDSAVCAADISVEVEKDFGFTVQTFVMSASALKKAATNCPYKNQAEKEPKSVHLFFLESKPAKEAEPRLDAVKAPTEMYAIADKVLYLHTPKGLAGSKIAEKADRILKVKTTARNWNTVQALLDLAKAA